MGSVKFCTAAARVAPHTGMWIEILHQADLFHVSVVAPHTGMWIEMGAAGADWGGASVAPHTGMWIEITPSASRPMRPAGCSPHGDVD